MAEVNITVLGAGVSGLTTALLLSKHAGYNVTIVAKHVPGDYDIEYASPWAGANYMPVGSLGSPLATFERDTWPELDRLARDVPEAGIHYQESVRYKRNRDAGTATSDAFGELMKENPWYKDLVYNFRVLRKEQLPSHVDADIALVFTSVCINTTLYLPYLQGQCLKNGVVIKRAVVKHVTDAADLHHSGQKAHAVINCTGLSSRHLGGVQDLKTYPGRGQTLVVRNDPKVMASISGTDDGEDEMTYMMLRAGGGGCVLGGCLQKNNWESQPDPNLATRIMKRCVALNPTLTNGKGIEALDIVRHAVGLRPMREGGPRVEKEKIKGTWVIHNYGHGGYGYQSSYGSAMAAERLLQEAVKDKARL